MKTNYPLHLAIQDYARETGRGFTGIKIFEPTDEKFPNSNKHFVLACHCELKDGFRATFVYDVINHNWELGAD